MQITLLMVTACPLLLTYAPGCRLIIDYCPIFETYKGMTDQVLNLPQTIAAERELVCHRSHPVLAAGPVNECEEVEQELQARLTHQMRIFASGGVRALHKERPSPPERGGRI